MENLGLSPVRKRLLSSMTAWQLNQYGLLDERNLVRCPIPRVLHPDDVLVKVHAASVNPIDAMMAGGYGATTLNAIRFLRNQGSSKSELPLILGRDFSGTIVEAGPDVKNFKPGDEVWGASEASRQGTFAQFHVVSSREISKKPKNISHTDAASLPYVTCTSWTALRSIGNLDESTAPGKRVLILAGSGGIGSLSIQLLKAWGAEVTAICSTRAVSQLTKHGADVIIDYDQTPDIRAELDKLDQFDLIFDNLGRDFAEYSTFLKPNYKSRYVTIVVPLLRNNDAHGLVGGLTRSARTYGSQALKGFRSGRMYCWALFLPSGEAMATVARLVEKGKILPFVEQVLPFVDVPRALETVKLKKSLGKLVIDVAGYKDD